MTVPGWVTRLAGGLAILGWSCFAQAEEAAPPIMAIGFYAPVVRDIPRKDVEVTLRFWVEELARAVNLRYRTVRFYDDIRTLRQDLNNGVINFMVVTSMDAAREFHPSELAEGFAGYRETPDHLILVVGRESGIRTPADLAGRRLVMLKDDQLSQIYMEVLMAESWGKVDWGRFGAVSHESRSSKLAHRLFFGQADAALMGRGAYEAALAMNPQIGQRLEILEPYTFRSRSPHIGLFSARVPAEIRSRMIRAALKVNDTTRGRQLLQTYHADAIVPTSVSELEPFRNLLQRHAAIKATARTRAGQER